MKSRLLRFVALQVALCLLLLWIWPRFGVDDSYIFLTYARHLASSGLFAFNAGEVSYGFSSPAYVVVLALASRLTGIPVGVMLSNLLGVLFCGLSAASFWMIWEELGAEPTERELLPTAVLMSGPWFFTVWFVFGMETGLAVLGIAGFLLWLVKMRSGAPRFPWLLVGVVGASLFATTRLESGIYIGGALVAALVSRGKAKFLDIAIVGVCSGAAEIAWLLYAHRMFGTYMPWTSTARLIYYIPGRFGLVSAAQYLHAGVAGRCVVGLKALGGMLFGGPMKFLLVAVPLIFAALYSRKRDSEWAWMLRVAAGCMALQMAIFSLLFPLAQNRHFAPYIAGLWALVVPAVVKAGFAERRVAQAAAWVVIVGLWVGGAVQYRHLGLSLEPLHELAASGELRPDDRLAAEPIGIVSFESSARIIDEGGLTERDAWPHLLEEHPPTHAEVAAWDIGKGATKILLQGEDCGPQEQHYGGYCLVDAETARRLLLTGTR